ncbi:MAG: NAD(P)H-hydrate epimerase, partial [Calditrichia bacterium]
MLNIVTSDEMREMDRHTIEDLGVPGVVLMENAGVGTYRIIKNMVKDLSEPLVFVFCGKGNNGGDGFVIARHLWDSGCEVHIFIIAEETDISGDARTNFDIVKKMQIPYSFITEEDQLDDLWEEYPDIVVDALLGTGIKGAVHGFMVDVIRFINGFECPVVAVDVPSGLNADSPDVEGDVIDSDVTVTMALPKRCHVFHPAKSHVGELYIADIGIPKNVRNSDKILVHMVEKEDIFLPLRQADTHKYKCGTVTVLAGSPGFTGAATLSSEAALRIGAGLITLAIPEGLGPVLETKLTEVIKRPYFTGDAAHFNTKSIPDIQDLLDSCDVLAIGPGLGRSPETIEAIMDVLNNFKKPAVIDADALFAMSKHPEIFKTPHPNWILTPHHGEFFRFLKDISKEQLAVEFISLAQNFSRENKINLLLKGAPSIVSDPEGRVYVNPTGNPGLASGGTG